MPSIQIKNNNMKSDIVLLLIFTSLFIITGCSTPVHRIELSRMIDGLHLAERDVTESYIYTLARYLVIRQEHIDFTEEGVEYNKIKVNDLENIDFVNPNLDEVYLEAWLAVNKKKPVILEVPEIHDRYYTVQICDEWAEIITNINERNFPNHASGKFALCLKGSYPEIPEGAHRIDLPSEKAKMLIRIERKEDDRGALELAQAFMIRQHGVQPNIKPVDIPMFTNESLLGVEIFDNPMIGKVLASAVDLSGNTEEYLEKISIITEFINKSEENRETIDRIIRVKAVPKLFWFIRNFGDKRWGWRSTAAYREFGNDLWFRCATNLRGIWWNSSNEMVTFIGENDMEGNKLNGSNTYQLHYSKKNLPQKHVDGYWSLNLLSLPDYRVVPNKKERYRLSNLSFLKYGNHGSLKIYLAPELPPGVPESNWLPTPKGKPYSLSHKLYIPREEVLTGKWYAPPIQKVN